MYIELTSRAVFPSVMKLSVMLQSLLFGKLSLVEFLHESERHISVCLSEFRVRKVFHEVRPELTVVELRAGSSSLHIQKPPESQEDDEES
jgi:hypothetical protein